MRLGFYPLLALYILAHLTLRLLFFRNLQYDEAEQFVFVQQLAWGYSGQGPLYTWLFWGLAQVLGANLVTLTLLKMALLAALYALLYAVALRVVPRYAGLVAFSPLLVPTFAWESLRMMTHTALLCVLCLALLLVVLRLRERGATRDYVLLGLCLGLGILSKYNFALFAAALGLAALSLPAYRVRFWDRRFLLALLGAVLLAAPHLWWLLGHLREAAEVVQLHGRVVRGTTPPTAVDGLASLTHNFALAAVPLLLTALIFLRRGQSATDDRLRLLGRLLVISAGLLAALSVSAVYTYRTHWFGPLLLVLPLWLVARWGDAPLPAWRGVGYATVLALAALGAFGARVAPLCVDYHAGMYQARDYLYAEQAQALRAAGQEPCFIVTDDPLVAGYHRLYFPEVPVRCLSHATGPTWDGTGLVLVIWDAADRAQPLTWAGAPARQIRQRAARPRVLDRRQPALCYYLTQPAS